MDRHQAYSDRPRLQVAVTGASGLIGTHLSRFLSRGDHTVVPMVRRREQAGDRAIYWNAREGEIDQQSLEGVDAVVHLAGENVFGLWTDSKKERIYNSRKQGTELVASALAGLDRPPKVFVSSSAVGYYGDTGDTRVDESSPAGDGFLAEVCKVWEAATSPAAEAGIRTIQLRTGIVFSKDGGALSMMRLPFKMGVGGQIGSGDQFMSWIHINDAAAAIHHCLMHDELDGPVNAVSPNPVTNRELTDTLGEVLGRPTFMRVPEFAIKLAAGQFGRESLLAGQRVAPRRLAESGFQWEFANLEEALRAEFARA